jgi:hypothetical protein
MELNTFIETGEHELFLRTVELFNATHRLYLPNKKSIIWPLNVVGS